MVIGYLGILGWLARNGLGKLDDNFESLKNRVIKDYEKRRMAMNKRMGVEGRRGEGGGKKLRNLSEKD